MNILEKNGITPFLLGILTYIKINSSKDLFIQEVIREYVFDHINTSGKKTHSILEEMDLVKYIKGTKKSEPWETIRLSEKGERILKEMYHKEQNPLAEYMLECTKKEYERIGADKTYIKGGDKILYYISEFLDSRPTPYTEKMIQAVLRAYSSQFEYDKKYLLKMQNLYFKSTNVYATKFSVEDCPLHDFINREQNLIKTIYKKWQ